MGLRSVLTTAFMLLALLTLATAATFYALGVQRRAATARVDRAMENVQLAEEMQLALLRHARTADPNARQVLSDELRMGASFIRDSVRAPEHVRLVNELDKQLQRYLRSGTDVDAAYTTLSRLLTLSLEERKQVRTEVAVWTGIAEVAAIVVAFVAVLGIVGVLFWLRRAVFQPVAAVETALRSYAHGDKHVRVPVRGSTELRLIAHRFNEMARQIERQNQTRMSFLGGVAHDLRNPLAALKLSVEAVSLTAPESRTHDLIARAKRQIDRLDRMVWDLLDAARVEAGALELRLEHHDLRQVVTSVVDQFTPGAPGHTIEVHAIDEELVVNCDSERLEQVISNLLSNAVKYSPTSRLVEVTVSRSGDTAVLAVRDEGIGISEEDMGKLFEPFQRGEATRAIPGVGLGLYVARRIVEAHGGRLAVDSAPGKGSTFSVFLPLLGARRPAPRGGPDGNGADHAEGTEAVL